MQTGVTPQTLFLVRGLPGVGKSTLGRSLGPTFAADDYFTRADGTYAFDPFQLAAAHADCQDRVMLALAVDQTRPVVVANTFSQRWELEPYFQIAARLGVNPVVVDLFDGGLDDAALAARCVHGVPEATIAAMRARWEHDWAAADTRPPWLR
jgi:predicted kinase